MGRYGGFIVVGLIFLGAVIYVTVTDSDVPEEEPRAQNEQQSETENVGSDENGSQEPVETIAQNLSVPWDVAQLPDGELVVTERTGDLLQIDGSEQRSITLGAAEAGEGGLLGVVLHPQFQENNFLYVYATEQAENGLINRVTRYQYDTSAHEVSNEAVIIDDIPGASYHDGGRMAFGPDGYLYITTGDAGNGANAQDTSSLAGKILRLEDDGSIPNDNPFGNEVWTYGHRNPQGLAWDDQGRLWSTEHGRSGIQSGLDELNLIERGNNYGWPEIEGDETRDGMVAPVMHSGADTTWAPASLAYLDGQLFWGGLRGQTLYRVDISGDQALQLTEYLDGEYGRIRTVSVGPGSTLYVTTSNTDGRGSPRSVDDVLLRVDPNALE